jgi:hypothetical protein
MQITTIKVNPRTRPNGSVGYQSSYAICADMTDAQILAYATNVCTTDRSIDRAHILNHIQNGNFIIERTASC